jgi:hypothetical protein
MPSRIFLTVDEMWFIFNMVAGMMPKGNNRGLAGCRRCRDHSCAGLGMEHRDFRQL